MDGIVVVMDNSEFERRKVKTVLESIGVLSTEEVPDKESIHSVFEKGANIHLIIMDIAFPDVRDGFEMLSAIRAKTAAPIIISTRLDRPEIKAACLEYGVNDYIIKPCKLERLKNSIQSVIKIEKEFEYDFSGIVNITMSFEEYAAKELKYSQRTNHPFSMIVINPSSQGFALEEKIQTAINEKIKQTLRSTDSVFINTNGDMLILLPSTNPEKAGLVSGKLEGILNTGLSDAGIRPGNHFFIVSVTFPDDGNSLNELLKNAFRRIENKKTLEEMTSVLESERERVKATYGRYTLI